MKNKKNLKENWFTYFLKFMYELNRGFGEFRINTINSFDKIKGDTSLIKEDINLIKMKMRIK